MDHFTPSHNTPREESLAFIRAFARFYTSAQSNEQEARQAARAVVCRPLALC